MVYVIGSVERSGGFVLNEREGISVLEVLALAGGLSKFAAANDARILRRNGEGGSRQEVAVNVKKILKGDSQEVSLQGNDILFIPEAGGKAVAGKAIDTMLRVGTGLMVWRVGR
jgi:polysaccharide export outer membrane protein